MASALEVLRQHTAIYMDTMAWKEAEKFRPVDATSNPAIICANLTLPHFSNFVEKACRWAKEQPTSHEGIVSLAVERLQVDIALDAAPHLTRRVHTQLDARLANDTNAMVAQGRRLIAMFEQAGLKKTDVGLKIPTTWEGLQAARILEKEHGIIANMTILFGLQQAIASAEAGAHYISPYLNRLAVHFDTSARYEVPTPITNHRELPRLQQIHAYYMQNRELTQNTTILCASFQTIEEVELVTGIDAITVSPPMLEALDALPASKGAPTLTQPLFTTESGLAAPKLPQQTYINDEAAFRKAMAEDPIATEYLAEGLRIFTEFNIQLDTMVKAQLAKL